MRRALVATWLSGSATGLLVGLFGVQLVTSGITVGRVTPLSRPEVLSALRAAEAAEAPQAPVVPASPPVPAPEVETVAETPLPATVSQPAVRPPASPPPRPGAGAGPLSVPPPVPPPASSPPPTVPATPATVVTLPSAPTQEPARPADPPPPAEPAKPAKPAKPPKTTTSTRPAEPSKPAEPAPAGNPGRNRDDGAENQRGAQTESRTETISSMGGAVSVRYEDGRVKFLWARPNPGYTADVASEGPQEVKVRFTRGERRSRILAYYQNGVPAHEVTESGDDEDEESWDGRWRWNWEGDFSRHFEHDD